jgi:L-asparaginase
VVLRPAGRHKITLPEDAQDRQVALLTIALGDDGRLLPAVEQEGYAGLVIESMGGGHVPSAMVEALEDLAGKMPVILASRTKSGEVLHSTYGFPGSETDLLERGLISAGLLNGLKARLFLTLLLRSGAPQEKIRYSFDSWFGE